jgi:hypothetical protein
MSDLLVSASSGINTADSTHAGQSLPVSAASGINLHGSGATADTEGYLGRFTRGQKITLSAEYPSTPDAAPAATVRDPDDISVGTFLLPMRGGLQNFAITLRIGDWMTLGRYSVTYSFSLSGVPGTASDSFDLVAGGDSGGEVISLFSYDRPEGRYVLAQLGSGKLMQGRNPHL